MCLNSPFILYKVISYWWLLSLLQYSIDYKTVDQCSVFSVQNPSSIWQNCLEINQEHISNLITPVFAWSVTKVLGDLLISLRTFYKKDVCVMVLYKKTGQQVMLSLLLQLTALFT